MTTSRREFLKRGTWMALAAGVPLSLPQRALGMSVPIAKTATVVSVCVLTLLTIMGAKRLFYLILQVEISNQSVQIVWMDSE